MHLCHKFYECVYYAPVIEDCNHRAQVSIINDCEHCSQIACRMLLSFEKACSFHHTYIRTTNRSATNNRTYNVSHFLFQCSGLFIEDICSSKWNIVHCAKFFAAITVVLLRGKYLHSCENLSFESTMTKWWRRAGNVSKCRADFFT